MTSLTLAALSARMLPYARVSFLLSPPRGVCTTLVVTAVGGFLSDLNLLISDRDADELVENPSALGVGWLLSLQTERQHSYPGYVCSCGSTGRFESK